VAAIITNIDREHLDFYKNLGNIKKAFLEFISNIQVNGILIVNRDNKNLFSLKSKIEIIAKKNHLRIRWYSLNENKKLNKKLSSVLKIPGQHNISNSLAVYWLAKTMKLPETSILRAIGNYHGAWRRMDYRGKFKASKGFKGSMPVYDDYAHHPSEIKATLAAFREKYPKSRLICVFQPHQEQRLKYLFKEFAASFDLADNLILLDVFKVKGREKKTNDGNLSKKLAEAIQKRINWKLETGNWKLETVIYLPQPEKLRRILKETVSDNSVIIMMGAGNIYNMIKKIII